MATTKVSVKAPAKDDQPERSITVEYDFGDTKDGKASIAGMTKRFTEEITAAHARSSVVVALQGFIRARLRPGKDGKAMSDDAIREEVAAWKPSVKTPGKSIVERTKDAASKMTAEERAELLAALQAG